MLLKGGRTNEALKLCEKLCARSDADSASLSLLGEIYFHQGRFPDAAVVLQRAIQLEPDNAAVCSMLADSSLHQGQTAKAAEYYRMALQQRPDDPKLLTNLAGILSGMHRSSEAEPLLRRAVQLAPHLSKPYTNLGSSLQAQGKVDEALEVYENGLKNADDDPQLHSNYLLARHYSAIQDSKGSLVAHKAWGQRHACSRTPHRFKVSERCNTGKLRVGYISPDFRTHSVPYFLMPLFENYDRDAFEVICYSDVYKQDSMTRRLQGQVDGWRNTVGFTDEKVDQRIRSDGIDILVDLAGHTADNRLGVFARRSAPVQITWLGYPDTTGLDEMDYRISDGYADPSGFEEYCSEQLLRLDKCFLCYGPPQDVPLPGCSPVGENGFLTFGSFNNLAKINNEVLRLWADVLKMVPGSRLVIKNPGLTDAATRQDYLSRIAAHGIDTARITLKGLSSDTKSHLDEYGNIDIGLDTFPYNGTTTTCEAMWMGVPVLTLAGNVHASRVGSSLLQACNMDHWIAESPQQYIDLAVKYAFNSEDLASERHTLRERMAGSILCDAKRFTGSMEEALLHAWHSWCRKEGEITDIGDEI